MFSLKKILEMHSLKEKLYDPLLPILNLSSEDKQEWRFFPRNKDKLIKNVILIIPTYQRLTDINFVWTLDAG